MQRQIAEEAQKAGLSVPEYIQRVKMQAAQQQQMRQRMMAQQQAAQQSGQPVAQQPGAQPGQQVPIQVRFQNGAVSLRYPLALTLSSSLGHLNQKHSL